MKKKTAGLLLLAGVWAWTGGTAMAENTLEGSADNDYTATVNTGDSWTYVYGRKARLEIRRSAAAMSLLMAVPSKNRPLARLLKTPMQMSSEIQWRSTAEM